MIIGNVIPSMHRESNKETKLQFHLKRHAITNVMAGRTLAIAAANVAVVYFIPKK